MKKFKSLLYLLAIVSFKPLFSQTKPTFPAINPEAITIVRDTFGIPHIFAKTDAEVAYGFGWTNGEDNFKLIQETLIIGKGLSGIYEGKEGAGKDFLGKLFQIKDVVDAQYNSSSPEFLRYLDGYCQGLNSFAAKHKKEILLKQVFPVHPKDLMATYTFMACFLAHVQNPVRESMTGKFDEPEYPFGSNAYAVSPSKSTDGKTYLVMNPHQPLDGPFSWHEAHLCSEEGLNIIGAHFPVGNSIFMGTNENLAWAMTSNDDDLVDTYKLKMHPTKKLNYEFDGQWKELEVRKIKLKVKIGPLKIKVKKTAYQSIYGPTLVSKSKKDFYSIRTSANMSTSFAEQYYFINKAKNFDEFYKALKIQGFPLFNIVYADKEGNIFFIDNGRIPKRAEGYNWQGILPGNTSKTLWTDIYREEDLPQVKNPACGYVYNMNNTPFNATGKGFNLDSTDYKKFPKSMGLKYTNSNRSIRFKEQIEKLDKVDYETFKKIKFDISFSDNSPLMKSIEGIFKLDASKYPDIAKQIELIKKWDKVASLNSVAAAYAALSLDYIFKKHGYGYDNFFEGAKIDALDFPEALANAKKHFLTYFGKEDVTLGEFQRHSRGVKSVPLPGYSDVLAANYIVPGENGRYKGFVGDSYIQFVTFNKSGPELIESQLPFGNSDRPESKHYTDQMDLYTKQQTKKLTFSKRVLDIYAEKTYHPQ